MAGGEAILLSNAASSCTPSLWCAAALSGQMHRCQGTPARRGLSLASASQPVGPASWHCQASVAGCHSRGRCVPGRATLPRRCRTRFQRVQVSRHGPGMVMAGDDQRLVPRHIRVAARDKSRRLADREADDRQCARIPPFAMVLASLESGPKPSPPGRPRFGRARFWRDNTRTRRETMLDSLIYLCRLTAWADRRTYPARQER